MELTELSLDELEGQYGVELPARDLMSHFNEFFNFGPSTNVGQNNGLVFVFNFN